ncbi:MAG: AAA family ATPase, partial [Propionibacteriaceae bacterium]|nr:AAA family ATPase [Propionibacteriaceae bacterium]
MTLQPAGYVPRIADAELAHLLSLVGAVEIQGPKWCGKTWLGRSQANSEVLIQDPTGNYRIRQLAQLEPLRILEGATPRLIDEWADVPGLWDAVRIQVDQQHTPGQFILTASSVPKDTATAHTGTGRIARMVLWPMSLAETGISTGEVSLKNLMDGNLPTGVMGSLDLQGLLSAILRGGWPDSVGKPDQEATELPSIYLDGLVHSDVSRIDGVLRDPVRMEAL